MFKILLTTLSLIWAVGSINAETYFWVGGTGNWSDTTHWATTSGGNINFGIIPTAEDDVVFDQNSFFNVDQIVSIDVATASCRNMNWNNANNIPTLNNPAAATLIVNGDLILRPQMNFDYTGTLIFRGAGGPHVVNLFNHTVAGNVYFDDAAGEWNVISPLRTNRTLFVRKGTAEFNNVIEANYLHIVPTTATDNCTFISNGAITLNGNNTTSGGNPFETMKVNSDFADVTFNVNTDIELVGNNVTLRVLGATNNILFPNVNFSNAGGNQFVTADPGSSHTYNAISFGSQGYIYRSSIINDLTLSAGKTYFFGANQDFQIDALQANGSCNAPIYVFSTANGTRARFNSGGTVTGSFLNIRDIEITAGNFQVTDAKDLGNIQGWNLTDIGTQTLYWIGGNGDWQDQNNWSYTSGGVGGACIPTPIDDVIFDMNSFNGNGQTVTLSAELSYCRNMTWNGVIGTPTFQTAGRPINISGSLTLDANMNTNINSIMRFDAFGGNHTITSSGLNLGPDVRLEGINATYTLVDDLNINGRLLHVRGGLIANGNTINLVEYYSNYSTARTLDIRNSRLNVAGIPGRAARWDIRSNGYTLLADNSEVNIATGISLFHRGTGQLYFDRINFNSTGNIYAYDGVDARFQYVYMPSSSFVFANNQFDTLTLQPSQTYIFSSGSRQTIGRLESIGTCEASINLMAQQVGREAIFFTDLDDSEVTYTLVQDIHVQGSGRIENILGVDNGNTDGWIIPTSIGRELYWIGNGGNWNDTGHWSASSGGPGGECVPTSIDNVYFDQNSFNQAGQVVTGGNIYFKNMLWDGTTDNPAANFNSAYAFGSVELEDNMTVNNWAWIRLLGSLPNRILDTRGKAFVHLELNALGDWTMASDINSTGQLYIYNGGLQTDNFNIRSQRFRIWERNNLNISLGNSTIDLFGDGATTPQFAQYQSDAATLNFDAGTSTINIEHPSGYTLIGSDEVNLYNLNFTPNTGRGLMDVRTEDLISYNKVTFNNDGRILRQHVIDSLIFASGMTYTLHSGRTQVVNEYLEIMGSPCALTTLQATSVGVAATILKVNGDVNTDYIRMRDQIGEGVNFNAGQHSINVANSNTGWVFENITDENPERGILGADQILCDDTSITIEPFPFESDLVYVWNDGDNASTKSINTSGLYWADITFDATCTVRDTINLIPQIYSNTELGADTALCDGELLELNIALDSATYMWQDGSIDSVYIIDQAGQYSVNVMYEGCPNTDTINVAYNPIPQPNLGADRELCLNDVIELSPNNNFTNILWSDGSTGDQFTVNQADSIWVSIEEGGCENRDSIVITYFDLNNYLGPDTTVCFGDVLNLNFASDGTINREWQDGSTGPLFVVEQPGTYSLELTRNTCSVFDEIVVAERPLPILTLDREAAICDGDSIEIVPTSNGDTFVWSNESNTLGTTIGAEGTYQLTAFLDGCSTTEYITVFVDEPIELDLGADTTVCIQNPLYINLNIPDADFEWNDGSTAFSQTISESGYFQVVVTRGACTAESDINVIVEECKEFAVFTPNIFSPNGDGRNDEFLPQFDQSLQVHEYSLTIFNRWGGIVFQTTDIDRGWDGTVNGKALQRGNYIYSMEFSFTDELKADQAQVNGDVYLAR